MTKEEKGERVRDIIGRIVKISLNNVSVALDVFLDLGGVRLRSCLLNNCSNGTKPDQLKEQLYILLYRHGPPPEYVLTRLYSRLAHEGMPKEYTGGIKTLPNGLCFGPGCSFEERFKMPVEEIVSQI